MRQLVRLTTITTFLPHRLGGWPAAACSPPQDCGWYLSNRPGNCCPLLKTKIHNLLATIQHVFFLYDGRALYTVYRFRHWICISSHPFTWSVDTDLTGSLETTYGTESKSGPTFQHFLKFIFFKKSGDNLLVNGTVNTHFCQVYF